MNVCLFFYTVCQQCDHSTAATIVKVWDLCLDVSNIQTKINLIKFVQTKTKNKQKYNVYIQTNKEKMNTQTKLKKL